MPGNTRVETPPDASGPGNSPTELRSGSHALVIGGHGAIGSAICSAATRRGVIVTATARSDHQGGRRLDVLNDASIEALVTNLRPVDHVVFAQGIQPSQSLRQTSRAHIGAMLDVHVVGTLLCLQQLLPLLTKGSSIVLVSSLAVRKGSYDPAYAAAKGAVDALVRSLAAELHDISRVNGIAPGLVAGTPVHESMPPAHEAKHVERSLSHRLVTAEQVAALVVHLWANPAINAAVVPIDGGYCA